jgi:hypothetical protein
MNLLSRKLRATSTVRATQRPARLQFTHSRHLRHRLPPRICRLLRITAPRSISTRHILSRPTRICPNPSSTAKNTAWSQMVTRLRLLPPLLLRFKTRRSRVSLEKLLLRRIRRLPTHSRSICATVPRSTQRPPRRTATRLPKTSRR